LITILDYGLGNVLAFQNVFKRINVPVKVAATPRELDGATKLILPGVGHFDHAMTLFNGSGLREPVTERVRGRGMPVIGICVGMQMLAQASEEGELSGLGWVPGQVRKFDPNLLKHSTRLPHMGWNDVTPTRQTSLFNQLEGDARFYFLHTYYFDTAGPAEQIAVAQYGRPFACAVNAGNVWGVQFHPEKSHHWGSRLLQNFAEL
jgi:imidazole glycerol-phosphate synthase subunit HisH